MTPQEALDKAMRDALVIAPAWDDPMVPADLAEQSWSSAVAFVAEALADRGFTVARTQDARDGEALRLLREACEQSRWSFSVEPRYAMQHIGFRVHFVSHDRKDYRAYDGVTIAEAADACREALR